MTNQEIFDLMDRFERSTLQTMKLSTQEITIELSRGSAAAPLTSAPAAEPAAPSAVTPPAGSGSPVVTAPLVGTFYAAPAPGQPPFVAVGDRVAKGQTLCLIEAMKMMSEVTAPCDCVIQEVLKADGELAAFGDALMRYQVC
jgi:acetyl-CoA carboxylase biotin carboxyl carrier protein